MQVVHPMHGTDPRRSTNVLIEGTDEDPPKELHSVVVIYSVAYRRQTVESLVFNHVNHALASVATFFHGLPEEEVCSTSKAVGLRFDLFGKKYFLGEEDYIAGCALFDKKRTIR